MKLPKKGGSIVFNFKNRTTIIVVVRFLNYFYILNVQYASWPIPGNISSTKHTGFF